MLEARPRDGTDGADAESTYPQSRPILSGDDLESATKAWRDYGRRRFRTVLDEVLDDLEWSRDHRADASRVSDAEVDELWRLGCEASIVGERGVGCRILEAGRVVRFEIIEWRDAALRSESTAHSNPDRWRVLRRRLTELLERTRR